MSARSFDAVVIGGGVSGLACASYLAKAKKRVLLLEARNALGGLCEHIVLGEGFTAPVGAHVLTALDPRVVRELKLAKHGLKFAQRDMALVGLGDRPVTIVRDVPDTVRHIAAHSAADAAVWPRYRNELFSLARTLRPFWWEAKSPRPLPGAALEALERFERLSAAAWLDSWFESDALKATLAFDAGSASFEPGSALQLVWRAAQEMSGLQGAVSWPRGGPAALVAALTGAAKKLGVEIQTGARVARIVLHEEQANGVELASGETIAAPLVFSSLSRRRTLCELAPGGAAGFDALSALPKRGALGEATVLLALKALPNADETSRFVVADRLEAYAAAASAARAGRLPDELVFEFVTPPGLAPPGQHVLSARVRPVPAAMDDEMKTKLGAKLVSALETHKSGLSKQIAAVEVLSPDDIATRYGYNEETDMLADWTTRLMTPIPCLLLCGAEPVAAVSGRAGRIAAALALGAKR
ncbi:MAG TPA: NAD(P)/FAD-dependent oxidoreductase [Rhizomicrobium sp.]|jgi:phytoene dehydrogenase-like protein